MRQAHNRLIAVLALALIVGGFVPLLASAQGTPAATPVNLASDATFETDTLPFPVPASFVEGESLECGFLTTPLVHAELADEQIRLFVIRLASPARDKLDTPLVFLAGGPGQGGSTQQIGFLPDPAGGLGDGQRPDPPLVMALPAPDATHDGLAGLGRTQPRVARKPRTRKDRLR